MNVSSVPFEERYRPPNSRRRKRERLTAVDRLVCGVCGAFLGLVLWTIAYSILLAASLKASTRHAPSVAEAVNPLDRLPPFSWCGPVMLGFALFSAVVGAERMMDGFEKVVRIEGEVARAVNRS